MARAAGAPPAAGRGKLGRKQWWMIGGGLAAAVTAYALYKRSSSGSSSSTTTGTTPTYDSSATDFEDEYETQLEEIEAQIAAITPTPTSSGTAGSSPGPIGLTHSGPIIAHSAPSTSAVLAAQNQSPAAAALAALGSPGGATYRQG